MKLVRREVISLKVETTYRTDAVPSPATDSLLVENLSWGIEGLRMVERNPIRPSLAAMKSLYAGSLITVSFDAEIKGSGTVAVAPEIGAAFVGCGMLETVTALTSVGYTPASTDHKSVTIYIYEDGDLMKLVGCVGKIGGNIETGNTGKVSFTFVGHLDTAPSATALPSPSYDSTLPVPLINVPFVVGAYSAEINALSFDDGNNVVTPSSISKADGYGQIRIIGRKFTGSFDPEADLVATKDFLAEFKAGTTVALDTGVIGADAGNKYQITMPVVNYTEFGNGDKDGIRTREIGFEALESTTDDEFSIVFT